MKDIYFETGSNHKMFLCENLKNDLKFLGYSYTINTLRDNITIKKYNGRIIRSFFLSDLIADYVGEHFILKYFLIFNIDNFDK